MNPQDLMIRFSISLITACTIFIIAGNLIFIKQNISSTISLDSLELSYTTTTSSSSSQVVSPSINNNSENKMDNKKQTSKTSQKVTGLERSFYRHENPPTQDSMLSLEGDYFPLLKLKPDYPQRALELGYEGTCLVEYTIEKDGRVSNVKVVESECSLWFEKASISAANSFIYKPRITNGISQVVENVRNKFVFKIIGH